MHAHECECHQVAMGSACALEDAKRKDPLV